MSNIPNELLARVQVTGITEDDYKQAEEYIKMIDTISPLFFQGFYIYDYYKMKAYYMAPNKYGLRQMNDLNEIGVDINAIYHNMTVEQQQHVLNHIAYNQDLIKKLPPNELKDYIFLYKLHINIKGKEQSANYRYKILQTAPDGRIWLELGVKSLSPYKGPNVLTALNTRTHEIWTINEITSQWNKTILPILSDKEKEILSMAAQGFMIKEIAQKLNRTESTIESHRKTIFKKLGVVNMIEAIGYAMNHQLI